MSTEVLKATKVRIYPTQEQAAFLSRQFGAARFVYNKALHIISSQYKLHGLKLKAKKDIKPLLAVAKKSRKYGWLKDFDSIALQQACINLDKAFQNFFDPQLASRHPKEPLKKSLISRVRVKNTFCQGASRRLHAVAIQRAEQHRQGVFLAEPLRAGLLRAICYVEAFAKVQTFAADFALHLIPQKLQRGHHGLNQRLPKFKRKHGKQSSYHCMSVKAGDNWIKVPKLGPIKARIHREITGTLKSITLSRTVTGKYYASLLMENGAEAPAPLQSVDRVLGVDMGLTHLAIDSEGVKTENPRFLKQAQAKLRRKQKALSRCLKGSRGRAKARTQLARAHERLANTRADFQHKLSRQLIDENQAVVVETLKVKNLLKNRKLAKHIADASWFGLVQKLEYKAGEQGKHLVRIDQWFASSKTCSCCHHKVESLPLSERQWACPSCHAMHDRDINAAINIRQQGILKLRAEGLSVPANGGLRKPGHVPAAA